MGPFFIELRGVRRALLILAILFFTIMLLEVDLGHRPALARGEAWLVLVPVIWLPISLLALIAVQIAPSAFTMIAALFVMAVAAVVGIAGSGLHMMAAGVDLDHLSRLFSSAVWGGPVSPNWPVAIAVAAVLGFIGALGAARDGQILRRDISGLVAGAADILILIGIAFAASPWAVMVSATSLVIAALLLLAALIAMLADSAMQRSTP
jgi:hypothetical protein